MPFYCSRAQIQMSGNPLNPPFFDPTKVCQLSQINPFPFPLNRVRTPNGERPWFDYLGTAPTSFSQPLETENCKVVSLADRRCPPELEPFRKIFKGHFQSQEYKNEIGYYKALAKQKSLR